MTKEEIISLEQIIYQNGRVNVPDALQALSGLYPSQSVFSTSFSFEDQIITHMIATAGLDITLFTLDTGRLFAETYSVWNSTLERFARPIKAYYPLAASLESFIVDNGPNSFYNSVDHRKQCCHIRKVEPLQRAIRGQKLWVTGIRAEHSPNRHDMRHLEWDAQNEVLKFHPLLDWTTEEVRAYISQHNIPYNPLHDKGFVSIGCAPCTRAIQPGEDFRSGRWWWEAEDKKECGLHVHASA